MLPRFHWSDITTVGHYLGVSIMIMGAFMLVPLCVALLFGELEQAVYFAFGMEICFAVGAALRYLRPHRLDRRRSLLLTGLAWIVVGLVAAIPFYLSGDYESYLDALFEAVSALTTTGATLACNVDAMSCAQVTWHAVLTLAGAQAVIIIALYYGPFGQGNKVFNMPGQRDGEHSGASFMSVWRTIVRVYVVYLVLGILAVFIIVLLKGLAPAEAFMNAFWLASQALSTSGFVPHTSNLVYYHSMGLQGALCVLMLLGAISFAVFIYVARGRSEQALKNAELRAYVVWIVFLAMFVTWSMTSEQIIDSVPGIMSNGLFMVISCVTTTGMQTVYAQQFGGILSGGVVIMLCVAVIFGACSYSTGGGIKIARVLQILRWVEYSVLLRLVPDSARVRVHYEHFGERHLEPSDAMRAMTICLLYIATAALGTMAFIAYGNDALDSVFEAVSYVSNCAMTAGITQADMALCLKIVALLLMWAGRLEFVSLIAVVAGLVISLHPDNSFNGKRSKIMRKDKSERWGGTAWCKRKQQDRSRKPGAANKTIGKGGTGAVALVAVLIFALAPAGYATSGATDEASGDEQEFVEELDEVAPKLEDDAPALDGSSEYRSVEIEALLSATSRFDGHEVTFSGEAVGTALQADAEHKWVNIKSNDVMVGVLMPNELADAITTYGSYNTQGDIVVIEGTYQLSCDEHAGELDVHASSVTIAQGGYSWEVSPNVELLVAAGVLVVIGAVLVLIHGIIHKSPRKIFVKLRRYNSQRKQKERYVNPDFSKAKVKQHGSLRGLLAVLVAIIVFMAFMALVTLVVHFIVS